MKLAIYIRNSKILEDNRFKNLLSSLASHELYQLSDEGEVLPGTDMILSLGGDGTFLSATQSAASVGVPIMGVNFGRLGFLSENNPEEVAEALASGDFVIEDREMLHAVVEGFGEFYALNEVALTRGEATMVGVDVTVNGQQLPTYWADGILVATSSGSTAYSLSVGGPICTPDTKVMIIAPVSPHNLNLRPLIVPSSAKVELTARVRGSKLLLSFDNRNLEVPPGVRISLSMAQFSLRRVRLSKSNFIGALKSRLFWGEDVRNGAE